MLDAGTADREDFALGETIEISTLQPKQDFEVVGIAKYGNVESLGTATFAIFDVGDRADALRPRGRVRRDLGRGRRGHDARRS